MEVPPIQAQIQEAWKASNKNLKALELAALSVLQTSLN
jgi:hypothetical protein